MAKKILFTVILGSSISSCNLTYMNNMDVAYSEDFRILCSNENKEKEKEKALILQLNNKYGTIDKIKSMIDFNFNLSNTSKCLIGLGSADGGMVFKIGNDYVIKVYLLSKNITKKKVQEEFKFGEKYRKDRYINKSHELKFYNDYAMIKMDLVGGDTIKETDLSKINKKKRFVSDIIDEMYKSIILQINEDILIEDRNSTNIFIVNNNNNYTIKHIDFGFHTKLFKDKLKSACVKGHPIKWNCKCEKTTYNYIIHTLRILKIFFKTLKSMGGVLKTSDSDNYIYSLKQTYERLSLELYGHVKKNKLTILVKIKEYLNKLRVEAKKQIMIYIDEKDEDEDEDEDEELYLSHNLDHNVLPNTDNKSKCSCLCCC